MSDKPDMTALGHEILTQTDPIRLNALAYACAVAPQVVSGLSGESAAVAIVTAATAFDTFLRGTAAT